MDRRLSDDNIIQVKDLTKQFGHFVAVNNISLDVKKGEIFAFLGPNGAGKTTTIKMLTTLLTPTSGGIILDGIDAVKEPERARYVFGIVFQDPSLDDELTAAFFTIPEYSSWMNRPLGWTRRPETTSGTTSGT